MAWTAADVTAIEASIRSLATNAVKSVSINGRSYTRYDLSDLYNLLDRMRAEVNAATYGASIPVAFEEVDD